MHILLLGKTSSITDTIKVMLKSIDTWSIATQSNLSSLDKTKEPTNKYDLILANLEDFEDSSSQVISTIRKRYTDLPLLVIHSYHNQKLIEPMIAAGASGYIKNDVSENMLVEAVRKVASGSELIVAEST